MLATAALLVANLTSSGVSGETEYPFQVWGERWGEPLEVPHSKAAVHRPPMKLASPEAPETIDVLALYNDAFRIAFGGDAGATAQIASEVTWTNQAFENSEIGIVLQLVEAKRIDEPNNTHSAVPLHNYFFAGSARLQGSGANAVNYARSLGVDVTSIFRIYAPESGNCGQAHLGGDFVTPESPLLQLNYTYKYVHVVQGAGPNPYQGGCDDDGVVFAHELGHNLGSGHVSGSTNARRPYSYGIFQPDLGFGTIMGGAGGDGRQLYSNPALTCAGVPCGDPATADNARAFNEYAPVAASWRQPGKLATELGRYRATSGETTSFITSARSRAPATGLTYTASNVVLVESETVTLADAPTNGFDSDIPQEAYTFLRNYTLPANTTNTSQRYLAFIEFEPTSLELVQSDNAIGFGDSFYRWYATPQQRLFCYAKGSFNKTRCDAEIVVPPGTGEQRIFLQAINGMRGAPADEFVVQWGLIKPDETAGVLEVTGPTSVVAGDEYSLAVDWAMPGLSEGQAVAAYVDIADSTGLLSREFVRLELAAPPPDIFRNGFEPLD